ncbi:phosphopantetheine-binding protein [Lacrimispora brassicae]
MINLSPRYSEALNCIENIIASLANYWEIDYYMMSSEVWGFSYQSFDSLSKTITFGERISTNSGDFVKLFEKHHDIKAEFYHRNSCYKTEELLDMIINHTKKKIPVMISIDLFWCPWTDFYKVYHMEHYCLVVGMNDSQEQLYCFDPYYTLDLIKLPIQNYHQGGISCILFERTDHKEKKIKWQAVLNNAALHFLNPKKGTSVFDEMCDFANDIALYYQPQNEFEIAGDKRLSLLSSQINYIRLARCSFADFLVRLANDYLVIELQDVAKEMIKLGESWYNLNIMFIKSSYMENFSPLVQRIVVKIVELAKQEHELALKLQRFATEYEENRQIKPIHYLALSAPKGPLDEPLTDILPDHQKIVNILVKIWREVLEKDSIGTDDDFFALGGNSLTLVAMHNKIEELFPEKIDVTDVFAYPTITKLSRFIAGQRNKNASSLRQYGRPQQKEGKNSVLMGAVNYKEIVNMLHTVSQNYPIGIPGIFLAGYFYLIYKITNEYHISIYFITGNNRRGSIITVNLDAVEDMADLLRIVDKKISPVLQNMNFSMTNLENNYSTLPVFCIGDVLSELPTDPQMTALSVWEIEKSFVIRFESGSPYKDQSKKHFDNYLKIIRYITQNC